MKKYFVNCPDCGFEAFETIEERDQEAANCIAHHLDEAWDEGVENVVSGVIEQKATQVDKQMRPDNLDEDNCDEDGIEWLDEWDYKCNYKMLDIEQEKGDCPKCGSDDVEFTTQWPPGLPETEVGHCNFCYENWNESAR